MNVANPYFPIFDLFNFSLVSGKSFIVKALLYDSMAFVYPLLQHKNYPYCHTH